MFDRRLMLGYLDGLITESERQQQKQVTRLRAKNTPEADKAADAIENRRGERFERVRQARISGDPVPSEHGREEREERAQKRASTMSRREATIDRLSTDFSTVLQRLAKVGKEPTTLKKNLEDKAKANKIEGILKKLRGKVKKSRGKQETPRRSVRRALKSKDNN